MISPSHSRMAGEAQINATRMKRTIDTLKSYDGCDATLHWTCHSFKQAVIPVVGLTHYRDPSVCE